MICQDARQTQGIIHSGFGKPYEYEGLPNGSLYRIPLLSSSLDWAALLEGAKTQAIDKVPRKPFPKSDLYGYVSPSQKPIENYSILVSGNYPEYYKDYPFKGMVD